MRALRDEHDVTADTIATHARRVGLSWQRSTVASIETGKRRLTAEELLLLPLILSMALPVRIGLRQLLDGEAALTEQLVMTSTGFQHLLQDSPGIWGGYKLTSSVGRPAESELRASTERWQRIERLWPEVHGDSQFSLERLRAVERAAAQEAEQNAARSLGWSALDVAAVAHRLWGHGLTEEREQRLEDSAAAPEPATAARVRRGHLTRLLLDELERSLTDDG
jgi:hypothetical protein